MNKLLFSKQFEKSFSRLRNKTVKKQIWQKILQLENRAPIGKKLKNILDVEKLNNDSYLL